LGLGFRDRSPRLVFRRASRLAAVFRGDDEQLCAFRQAFEDNIALPAEGSVVGEPVLVLAFDYDGNERRGLTAKRRGADGRKHAVAAADVTMTSA
jgi:hypothetical protein